MEHYKFTPHISGQFNAELEAIRTQVLAMGGLVERQLTDALEAIHNNDMDLAQSVKREDHKVNKMEVDIDNACTRIIAKRQPTAGDLRLVIAIIKTITDLERIGDVAHSLAKMVLDNTPEKQPFLMSLENFGHKAVKMLHDVLDAFARMDVQAALLLHHSDDILDKEYEDIMRLLMKYMMEDPSSIPNVLSVIWSARALERVGDRCQNICEYIIYFVKGKDIRHSSKEQLDNMLAKKKPL